MLIQHKRRAPAIRVAAFLLLFGCVDSLFAGFQKWTSQGPDGGQVFALAVDPSHPDVVYAGTGRGGVSRSLDGGATWEQLPAFFSTFTVLALATHPALPGVVFAGTDVQGAFKSEDYGDTWTPVGPGMSRVEDIVIDPSNPLTVYAAGYGGVFKSIDGGNQWPSVSGGLPSIVFSIAVDPSDSNKVYAGTTSSVYRSIDGGQNFSPSSSGIVNAPQVSALSVAIDPSAPGTLYAGVANSTYKSIDGAGSWVLLAGLQGVVYELRIDPSAPAHVYAGTNFGIKSSADGGGSWTTGGPANQFIFALAADPSTAGRIYAGTFGGGVFRTDDAGSTWAFRSAGMNRCFVNALAIHPTQPGIVFAGIDGGGVARSNDAGDHWEAAAQGITLPFVRALATHPNYPGVVFAGIEYSFGGGMFTSADNGATWNEQGRFSLQGQPVRAVAVDLFDSLTILAAGGFTGIFRSTDNGTYWQRQADGLPTYTNGAAFAFDPAQAGVVYLATDTGVYKSFDHGLGWQPAGLADVTVKALAADPFAPETLYAAGVGSGPHVLYKSETGGLSWSPADLGLSGNVYAIVADPAIPETLYAAGNGGIFVTTTAGDLWSRLGDPLEAPGSVLSLAMDSGGNILHAGSDARGVYEYQLHFFDAPAGNIYRDPVETLARNGISTGCGSGSFCVTSLLTRAQASVWLLRAMHGAAYQPPPATGAVFPDVPADAFAADFIEQLAAEGVTSGCGAEGFCPNAPTTRAQIAVWLLRAKNGPTYAPPPATGLVFADVPADAFAADWIEALAAAGITSGCGGGNYCPADAILRGQAAALLVRTFELK